ncbi:MAG: DNA repair protein RadC [Patescibacteria group bacterium]
MRIKDMPRSERPREKLVRYGPGKLSNTELLAILLRTGAGDLNAVELAGRILARLGGTGLAAADVSELGKLFGLGAAKACEIAACFELGRRLLNGKKSALLLSPREVWNELRDLRTHKKEHLVVFFLDARNQEITRQVVSVGTVNASIVHPREVFENAISHSAAQILLAHNHPSGDTEPSAEDIRITAQLADAGRILGIQVIDHVVISATHFTSMKACGLLPA